MNHPLDQVTVERIVSLAIGVGGPLSAVCRLSLLEIQCPLLVRHDYDEMLQCLDDPGQTLGLQIRVCWVDQLKSQPFSDPGITRLSVRHVETFTELPQIS